MKVPFRILPLVISLSAIGLTGCLSGGGGGGGSSDASAPPPSTSTPTEPTPPTLPPASEPAQITSVVSLSNDPILVSDGNVLVEVRLTNITEAAADIVVALNGQAVTNKFAVRSGNRFVGLVSGLTNGENTITASSQANPSSTAQLLVKNHPASGPIFSGPHLQPWVCANQGDSGKLVTVTNPNNGQNDYAGAFASGLSGPVDANCNIQREVTYFYQPTDAANDCEPNTWSLNACFIPFDTTNPPADNQIARFTNDRGNTVRSILAVERGALNRGMYSLSVFHDPEQPHDPSEPQKGWNNKIIFSFGGTLGGELFQVPPAVLFFNEKALRAGYMLANSTLNDYGKNFNHVVGAEALMMLKERIVETYGPIRYTIGTGGSGGSIPPLSISSSYPGLLDGVITAQTHADELSTGIEASDCGLITDADGYLSAYGQVEKDSLSLRFSGHNSSFDCLALNGHYLMAAQPSVASNCGQLFPASLVYHPTNNPGGIRCSHIEKNVNLLGSNTHPDGVTRANQPLDNVGVQYGLGALRSRNITIEQFIHINENIGYYDLDHIRVAGPKRGAADPQSVERAYLSGMVTDGRYLANVPIIDLRNNVNTGGSHLNWRAKSVRARINKVKGNYGNHVIWAFDSNTRLNPTPVPLEASFDAMDRWLSAIEADRTDRLLSDKVVAAKPADIADQCLVGDGQGGIRTVGLDSSECPVEFNMSPRQVAGGPRSEDVLKCQLKPFNLGDAEYTYVDDGDRIGFTLDQRNRLQNVFAEGVCDWSKPGVGQQLNPGWMSFTDGPDGVPLDLTWFERP